MTQPAPSDALLRVALVAPLIYRTPPVTTGGTERMVHDLAVALVAEGHDVTLFAADGSWGGTRLAAQGPAVTHVEDELGRAAVPPGYPAAREATMWDDVAAQAERFDVVHAHTEFMQAPVLRAMRERTLTTIHWRVDQLDRQHYLGRLSDLPVAAISRSQRSQMPAGARCVEVVHHGIPADRLRPGRGSRGDVVFLGRMTDQKGPDRAVAAALAAGLPVTLAGDIDIGNPRYFAERVEPLIAPEGSPAVRHVGPVDDAAKQEHLGEAGVLAMPIDWPEPFGLVMIEAMATGTPVVATPFGAAPEVVEDGVTGFVAEPADMPEALRAALRLDRARVRARFEERFTARRMARDYARIYRELVRGA